MWWFTLVEALLNEEGFGFANGSACCFGGDREKWYSLLNNCPGIQAALHQPHCPGHEGLKSYEVIQDPDGTIHYATEEEAEYKPLWCLAYARGLRAELDKVGWVKQALRDGRRQKIERELEQSTSRLAEAATARQVADYVANLEATMVRGNEAAHLREMARRTSIRGTDLRLLLGDNEMEVPYPAYRWLWKEILSYPWQRERHINEGEVGAFNVLLRRRAKDPAKHSLRYLAVVDSLVSRGAISKGRSPSRALNRLLKQTSALLLASDQYPLVTWTISRWNFADGASRRKKLSHAEAT